AAELVVGDHDAALDGHLPDGNIQLPDDATDFLEPGRRVRHEQYVRAWLNESNTALANDRALPAGRCRLAGTQAELLLLVAGYEIREVLRLHVVKLERFGDQRLELTDLQLRFELLLFLDRKFLAWRDQNDVAVLAHVETLGLHDDVQRLIPRDVLEPQRQAPGHGVAGNDVEAGKIGDDLQHCSYFDVLEVERQLLALVPRARPLRKLVRVFLDRLDLDDEPIVGLIRGMFPESLGLDDDPRVAPLREGVDRSYRSREVTDIEPAFEITREAGFDEVDDERLALLPDIDTGRAVGQVDNDAPFAVLAAAKIDVPQCVRGLAGSRFREPGHRRRIGARAGLVEQCHEDRVPIDLSIKGLRLVQVEDDSRA